MIWFVFCFLLNHAPRLTGVMRCDIFTALYTAIFWIYVTQSTWIMRLRSVCIRIRNLNKITVKRLTNTTQNTARFGLTCCGSINGDLWRLVSIRPRAGNVHIVSLYKQASKLFGVWLIRCFPPPGFDVLNCCKHLPGWINFYKNMRRTITSNGFEL